MSKKEYSNNEYANVKSLINCTTSSWDKKIGKKMTLRELIFGISCGTIGGLFSLIPFLVAKSIMGGMVFVLVWALLTFGFCYRNCFLWTTFINWIKWMLGKGKNKKISIDTSTTGFIKTERGKYWVFEIFSPNLTMSDEQIRKYLNEILVQFNQVPNWTIMSADIPFSQLRSNLNDVDSKIKKYVDSKNGILDKNDLILRNLIANKIVTQKYSSGNGLKNTHLLIFEVGKYFSIENITDAVKTINKNLSSYGFSLKAISKSNWEYLVSEVFHDNYDISYQKQCVQLKDEYGNTSYEMYIKIDELPVMVNSCFLSNLNNLSLNDKVDLKYSINTYEIKDKLEEKIWNRAATEAEAEYNRAKKRNEIIKAEQNLEALDELQRELVQTNGLTQKYSIVLKLSSFDKRELVRARRRIRKELKSYHTTTALSDYLQMQLFHEFIRNIQFNNSKSTYRLLPNRIIWWMYPMVDGNFFMENGLWVGRMFNRNPFLFNTTKGDGSKNNSAMVVGKTGCGKTTLVNEFILNNMSELDVQTLILDPKGEYVQNPDILKLKPTIFSLNNPKDLALNPFKLINISKSDDKPVISDALEFLLEYLELWMPDYWNTNLAITLKNIMYALVQQDRLTIEDLTREFKQRTQFGDYDIPHKNVVIKVLESICKGGINDYFAKDINVDLSKSNLIIFDVSEVLMSASKTTKIKLAMLFKLIKNFIFKRQDKTRKVQVIADEFPVLLKYKIVANEFAELIRTIRSFSGSIMLMLQDFHTLSSNPETTNTLKSITSNVAHLWLMKLTKEQIEVMKTIWGDEVDLSDTEEEMLMDFDSGDTLYIQNRTRVFFYASKLESAYCDINNNNELTDTVDATIDDIVQNNNLEDYLFVLDKCEKAEANGMSDEQIAQTIYY